MSVITTSGNNNNQQQLTQQQGPEWSNEQQVLLGQKNILSEEVLRKYNLAGQLCQTGLVYVESLLLESLNDDYENNSNSGMSIGEISRAGTRFLQSLVEGISKIQSNNGQDPNGNKEERGLVTPVRIEKMGFIDGVAPEVGETFQGGHLNDDDIVKIVLGVHIDGYTAQVAHTVVVRDYAQYKKDGTTTTTTTTSRQEQPVEGRSADAVCAAYLASEAVIALLGLTVSNTNNEAQALLGGTGSGEVTGRHIRKLVETVAKAFQVQIVPGSRVRWVRRFLAGQDDVVLEQDLSRKSIEWSEDFQELEEELEVAVAAAAAVSKPTTDSAPSTALALPKPKGSQKKSIEIRHQEFIEERDNADDAVRVLPGEVWLVDIQMCGGPQSPRGRIVRRTFQGYDESGILPSPTIFSRDVSVRYDLRLANSRSLLSQVSAKGSVFPFTLSQIVLTPSSAAAADESSRTGPSSSSTPVELRAARLGLKELVNHHLFVPRPASVAVWQASSTVSSDNSSKSSKDDSLPVAREMSTVVLVPADLHPEKYGEVLRLTGGPTTCQPAFVHSKYQVEDPDLLKLLQLVQDQRFGIRVRNVQPASQDEAMSVVGVATSSSNNASNNEDAMDEAE